MRISHREGFINHNLGVDLSKYIGNGIGQENSTKTPSIDEYSHLIISYSYCVCVLLINEIIRGGSHPSLPDRTPPPPFFFFFGGGGGGGQNFKKGKTVK